jgi:hypothetical protein
MEKNKIDRKEKLREICNTMVMDQPDAIGMAFIELNCGCIHYCGVSFKGEPVGRMKTITGRAEEKKPVCLTCYREKNINPRRVIKRGVVWPGDDSELPDRDLRIFIGQTVFGADYNEPDRP